jgi:hypothetical protein
MLTLHRQWGAAMTPSATAPTGHGPGALSLGRSEGATFLLGVPPCDTGSAVTATFTTPLRPGATLRHSPVPLSNGAGGGVLDHFGPMTFRAAIRTAPYPRCFWPPTHISMYDGETNPDHWLQDYCLAMKAEGLDNDFAI